MTSREYSTSDYEACLGVFDTNVPRFFTALERTEYSAFLEALPGPYFVFSDSAGLVVGCGGYAMREGSSVADLCWGMVREECHGRGFGRELADLRIERIRLNDLVSSIALSTSQKTVGFYRRLGFRITRVIPDGFGPGLDRCDMLLELG